ncbi:sigma 54-interacting transcriptional regulator [Lignipirellula cremea]|uniref:Transcriptional regulatory protein ZraR n=1 Tax=Lignipirellula cremea TaxID=2528010 RepID=A0A518DZL9_9BACT|nr:sigma 54-interacting transcriptional regulator [Lignipirellula cremea]QDU97279.1 Transcriptional regulatory protein ZraR [Lignipirellula cremea]
MVMLVEPEERRFLGLLSRMSHANPFLPERIELERELLGDDAVSTAPVWSKESDLVSDRANIEKLFARVEPLANRLRERMAEGATAEPGDLDLYDDLILYLLYYRFHDEFRTAIANSQDVAAPPVVPHWEPFLETFRRYYETPGRPAPVAHDPAHLFAGFFQVRRAFHHIYHFIVGASMPAARLRAAVWQSIFTHELRRYRRTLYKSLGDITTLISGPSGTGKELVARAIGLSRYIPFDVKQRRFTELFHASFYPLNLSALSPTLIESELFGHCRGAFTGAVGDRQGWLEVCTPLGTVFLDEIGELDPSIQVKLLRVLQSRMFQRLGESSDRRFPGKIIAATNRDLAADMLSGSFRQDFYYRLCSDMIRTPALHEQLADQPADLYNLVRFITQRIADEEAESIAQEVVEWIEGHLGSDYPWPGNIRELEQCVRNVMIRREYLPPPCAPTPTVHPISEALARCELSADQLLRMYCTYAYQKIGSFEQTAKALQLDRRTVKSKVDEELLETLQAEFERPS